MILKRKDEQKKRWEKNRKGWKIEVNVILRKISYSSSFTWIWTKWAVEETPTGTFPLACQAWTYICHLKNKKPVIIEQTLLIPFFLSEIFWEYKSLCTKSHSSHPNQGTGLVWCIWPARDFFWRVTKMHNGLLTLLVLVQFSSVFSNLLEPPSNGYLLQQHSFTADSRSIHLLISTFFINLFSGLLGRFWLCCCRWFFRCIDPGWEKQNWCSVESKGFTFKSPKKYWPFSPFWWVRIGKLISDLLLEDMVLMELMVLHSGTRHPLDLKELFLETRINSKVLA